MANRPRQIQILGHARMTSPWFSSIWALSNDTEELARIQRLGRVYASRVQLRDGRQWLIEPCGSGQVRVLDEDMNETARIIRRTWLGRRWDIQARTFSYELVSKPAPRRWEIGVGGAPFALLRGSPVSYNRIDIEAQLNLPIEAVLLAWHIVARPWEAAAAPRGLIPVPMEQPKVRHSPAPPVRLSEEPT